MQVIFSWKSGVFVFSVMNLRPCDFIKPFLFQSEKLSYILYHTLDYYARHFLVTTGKKVSQAERNRVTLLGGRETGN